MLYLKFAVIFQFMFQFCLMFIKVISKYIKHGNIFCNLNLYNLIIQSNKTIKCEIIV